MLVAAAEIYDAVDQPKKAKFLRRLNGGGELFQLVVEGGVARINGLPDKVTYDILDLDVTDIGAMRNSLEENDPDARDLSDNEVEEAYKELEWEE